MLRREYRAMLAIDFRSGVTESMSSCPCMLVVEKQAEVESFDGG